MADITVAAGGVRPLNGAIIRRFAAGAAVSVGNVVYIHTDSTIKPAKADADITYLARGIVVGVGTLGATTAAVGDMCDIVTHGPVELGITGLTDGAQMYVSAATAGVMDQTAPAAVGKYKYSVGYAHSDTGIYVDPQNVIVAAN